MTSTPKGVLLLAFGGADSIESVEPFVKNVLKGRPVTPELIEKTKERYKLIGGKSPLLGLTIEQGKAIEKLMNKDGGNYKVYVGMRYWHPFIKETLSQMKADGIKEAVAAIMAPFTSLVATGGYEKDVESALAELDGEPKVEFIPRWNMKPLFLDAVAEKLAEQLKYFDDPNDALVIFSNHSLPLGALEGDPYEMIINQSANEIAKKFGKLDYKVSYQSRGAGPREWLGPQTEDIIQQAKKKGKKGVIIVPLGFVADHVETLYDIDILFKGMAEQQGLEFRRTASLNDSPKLMELMADLLVKLAEKRQ
ncbi:MAG: ferrochelatase [Deltaproteobacteria bacterium]|nr:ferrochelatase [Deltaproteobacteria bacterium]